MNKQILITELQSQGLRLKDPNVGASGRKGGAGPSDHKAIHIDGTTVMVPVYTDAAAASPFEVGMETGSLVLTRENGESVPISFPRQPQFYGLETAEGIPYWKIALLHSQNVLATTVLQTCMRYGDRDTACQFCAIGQSLEAGRTIARKTPAQLAEVAEAAVRLDGVEHMIMTTGTPSTPDRGAAYLTECAQAIRARVDLPIQAQCEPPADFVWFEHMKAAGIDSLGMHLEAVTPEVRAQVMPGKATVSIETYMNAFRAAVAVFGRGQVSTYLLVGLGDPAASIIAMCGELIALGVYPFVVPFVPIAGTPLGSHPSPDSGLMREIYQAVGPMLREANLKSQDMKAGCGKCGACSALSLFEN